MTSNKIPPAPMPQKYSAELVRSDGITLRIIIDEPLRRTETHAHGNITISIVRPDKGIMYSVLPQQSKYMSMPLSPESLSAMTDSNPTDELWTFECNDTINGITVSKYAVFARDVVDPTGYVHVDTTTGLRLKKVTLNSLGDEVLTVKAVNVSYEVPPRDCFEPPADYREVKM
ncbi:hypothetical protein [Bremerella alba]|uniref:DUF4412 domain-containing protein n=1 Tax=Bremerella alba TaxID=980252 RepID=A0A7V8V5E3_9BACT|nr:hypothetical protein [Bremerella alba]MBA2115091.1 hypothetical protein [Bremerella alba]